MIGEWIKWEPIKGLAKQYHLEEVTSNINGFKIKLSDAKNDSSRLIITFNDSVWAYRNVEEGFRLVMMDDLFAKYGTNFYTEWTLFEVNDSDYLKWLAMQSHNMSYSYQLRHFCIIAMDDILEIASNYEPEIKICNKGSE